MSLAAGRPERPGVVGFAGRLLMRPLAKPRSSAPAFPSTPSPPRPTLPAMRWLLVFLVTLGPGLAGDRVTFSDGAYSLEFPQGWEKSKAPTPDAEFARESPDGAVIISVNCDVRSIAKSSPKSYAQPIRFKGEAMISDGELDGCRAKFITLAPQEEDEGPIAMFAVFVDARKHLVRITATMSPQLGKETKDACLGIVKSFRREDAEKAE